MAPWIRSARLFAFALFACFGTQVPVSAQCPEEAPLRHYTGGGSVACPCFVAGEEAGVVLTAPVGHYPIEILKIRVGWGSVFGGTPAQIENAIHLYSGGLPNPGSPQFSLPGPLLNDGVINEFNIEFLPGNKIINSGPFTVTLDFLNTNSGNPFAPSVVHDGNGCQGGGLNVVKAIPGGWSDACLLGVTGDWVFEVVYRRVNCNPTTVPTISIEALVASAILMTLSAGILIERRRAAQSPPA